MKTKQLKRYFIGIAMTAFLALLAGNAFADNVTTDNATRDYSDGRKDGTGLEPSWANNYMVMSPYWQIEGGASYTFIAVSHSSLSGMASQIGVQINAITSAKTAYATAATFTVSAGETKRVFIIPTNHATINSTTVPDAVFIAGTTNFTYGHLRVNPGTSAPQRATITYATGVGLIPKSDHGDGFRDTTMLSYWGSVIVEANTTGFAMEFIGDMNDSTTVEAHNILKQIAPTVQGENGYMATGPNLN